MKGKENLIGKLLEKSNSFNKNKFKLNVNAVLRKENALSSKLKSNLIKEADKDNPIKNNEIFNAMAKELSGKIRSDIKGIPGQFMKVNYSLQGTSIDATADGQKVENHKLTAALNEDKDYDNLIIKLLKENN